MTGVVSRYMYFSLYWRHSFEFWLKNIQHPSQKEFNINTSYMGVWCIKVIVFLGNLLNTSFSSFFPSVKQVCILVWSINGFFVQIICKIVAFLSLQSVSRMSHWLPPRKKAQFNLTYLAFSSFLEAKDTAFLMLLTYWVRGQVNCYFIFYSTCTKYMYVRAYSPISTLIMRNRY